MRILFKEFPTLLVATLVCAGCSSHAVKPEQLLELTRRQDAAQAEIARLAGRTEQLENSLLLLQNQLEASQRALAAAAPPQKKTRGAKRAVPAAPPAAPAPDIVLEDDDENGAAAGGTAAASAGDPVRAAYQRAFELYEKQQYDEALVQFENFVKEHPRHELANNAVYWMGEVFYSQREFELAIQEFERVLREYPDGRKVPDAKVKMALAQEALGNRAEARRLMQEVLERHPQSRASRIAQQYLRLNKEAAPAAVQEAG